MTRPKSVALAFLAGALLVGGLLGFTADRVVFGERLCDHRAERGGRLRERLATDLDLSPAQRATVDSLLDARDVRVRALFAEVRPAADSLYLETRDHIRQVLTPEQRRQFEEFIARSNARTEKR
jgi:Spy/CpxP family protein refolding chaperone